MADVIEGDDLGNTCNYSVKYLVPSTDDTGDDFGQVIETFMNRMAAHTHNGQTSEEISLNITKDQDVKSVLQLGYGSPAVGTGLVTSSPQTSPYDANSNNFTEFLVSTVGDNLVGPWVRFSPEVNWLSDTIYTLTVTRAMAAYSVKVIAT